MVIKGDLLGIYQSKKDICYSIFQYGDRFDAYVKDTGEWADYSDVSVEDLYTRLDTAG